MCSAESLREFVSERLTAAAEEIFSEFVKTIVQYEEEIDRQRRLLGISSNPQTHSHTTELPQQHVCKEEEVPTDQERSSSLDQEEPELPQMKEELEELCTSQEGEQLGLKQETDTFMVTYAESQHREPEPNSEQLLSPVSSASKSQDQGGNEHQDSGGPSNNVENIRESQTVRGKQPVKCDFCGKAFKFRSDLKRHVRTHTGEKPHLCRTCGKRFPFSSGLSVHMRTHTGERLYSCHTCGKQFSDLSALKRHTMIHTGVKPHCCSTCGKGFIQKSGLEIHMRTHTGEKPYCCDICGKSWCQRSSLKAHMRTHTGEKPCSCEMCGKAFATMSRLNEHHKVHTGERPHSCSTCGKSFSRMPDLTRHSRLHAR